MTKKNISEDISKLKKNLNAEYEKIHLEVKTNLEHQNISALN